MITPCFYSSICIKLIYENVADMPYEERPFMLMLSIVPKVSSLIIFIHSPQTFGDATVMCCWTNVYVPIVVKYRKWDES